jgi:hypothetical protein
MMKRSRRQEKLEDCFVLDEMTLSAGRRSCWFGRPTKYVTRGEDILTTERQSFVVIIHYSFIHYAFHKTACLC